MYKTVRVPIYYDSRFEESFEEQLKNYDTAYKHAVAWYYDEAETVREFLEEQGAVPDSIPGLVWTSLPGTYHAYYKLTEFRRGRDLGQLCLQRAACCRARETVSRFLQSNMKKRFSRKALSKDGRRPRCKNPETLFKNQHTVISQAAPVAKKDGKLYLPGVGQVQLARKTPNMDMRSYSLTRKSGHIELHVSIREPDPPKKKKAGGPIIGIDAGVKHALAVSLQQDGTNHVWFMDPPENARRHKDDDIARLYSKRSKKKRGSRDYKSITRRIQTKSKKITNRAQNWERQAASFLSGLAGKVVVEDLNLQAMTKRKYDTVGNRALHRDMSYSRIGFMRDALEWACKQVGTEYDQVSPQYTSQKCCRCGTIDSRSRQKQAEFHCTCCRNMINADYNAAVNISVHGGAAAGSAVVKQEDGIHLLGFPRNAALSHSKKESPTRGRLMIAQIARNRRYAGGYR